LKAGLREGSGFFVGLDVATTGARLA